jgi:hypothetical protein
MSPPPSIPPRLPPHFPPHLLAAVGVSIVIILVAFLQQTEDESSCATEETLARVLAVRRIFETNGERGERKRRKVVNWDRDRARHCLFADYWGSPNPTFDDRMFERTFRVTRRLADIILQTAASADPYFTDRTDCLNQRGICPKVKMLIALKLLAYGCSASAFLDYFQMGETTARESMLRLCNVLSSNHELLEIYLRPMSRADARQISAVHEEQHGVQGMVGSLDCMHVGWKNCPVAWQGQTAGKEEKATIVLEAMCDHNLFFWHASFGWSGTLNDINIWDRSSMLKAFVDGTWSNDIDFEFSIGNATFQKLWVMVDGIYPELARFVKTIQEPVGQRSISYAKWQEGARKDIERAFGVLQRKFQILVRDSEQWYVSDIRMVVHATIVLHNMMVSHRISRDEQDNSSFYDCPEDGGDDDDGNGFNAEEEDVDRREAELELHRRLENEAFRDEDGDIVPLFQQQRSIPRLNNRRLMYSHQRWESLYNPEEHGRLRDAIMRQLEINYQQT